MENVIIQLQIDSLKPGQDVASLLRKAYLVAKKLDLGDFEQWIYKELNGYQSDDLIPEYRNIKGRLKFNNPYHGWLDVVFGDSEMENALSKMEHKNSIPHLQDLLARDGIIGIPVPPEVQQMLNRMADTPMPFKYALMIDKSSISNIIETVKNKILEWAILLEENGIQGKEMRFTNEEIEYARNPSFVQYINNFYSPTNNAQIQQGTNYSEQK